MATVIPLDVKKLALMSLMEDAEIIPSSFSNVSCTASDTSIFGFLPQTDPNTMTLGIKSAGKAVLTVGATCTFADPQSGQSVTQPKQKVLNVSVTGSGPNFVVEIN